MSELTRILALRRNYSDENDNASELEKNLDAQRLFNKPLFKNLFQEATGYKLISSSPKVFSAIHPEDFGEYFNISDAELEAYAKGFLETIKEYAEATVEETEEDVQDILEDSALDDKDVKLSLYRSFKSLYDKWISSSENSNEQTKGYFFNNYGKDDNRFLFDHFKFINRANQDIGGKAVIDPGYLSNLASSDNGQGGPTQSLYQTVTGLLSKNNFDFWPTPSNIDLKLDDTSDEDLKDIFRPLDYVSRLNPGPQFNCVYVGGSSRALRDINNKEGNCQLINDFNYNDDSFDIAETQDWPEEFTGAKDKGVVAFKVRYGQEAQNHFNTLQVDQTEFKETQESLQIIDALANPKQGNSPSQAGKGNNLYDIYLTRAYNCTVSGLGNMSIQPLMYFKLENVPMFRGTYLINNVKHTITPHNIKTEFTGLRQPKITIPVVEDPISLLDLVLQGEAAEGTPGSLGTISGTDYNSSNGTYNLSYNNKEYPVVPGGKCKEAKSKDGCKSCLGEEFTTLINGFETPVTFSGQEIEKAKAKSSFRYNSTVEKEIIPIINSEAYKTNYTKGHRMFALAWVVKEGYKPGSKAYRTKNPGNIGNTDSGAINQQPSLQAGMDLLMDFLKEASIGGTKYGKGWAFGERTIEPYWSKEIANNPQTYLRVNGCLPGYQGNYVGQLGFFSKRYATAARVGNRSIGQIVTIFSLNGKSDVNGNTTIKALLDFNNNTPINFG